MKPYWFPAPSEAVFGWSCNPVQNELVSRLRGRKNQISYLAGLVTPTVRVFPEKPHNNLKKKMETKIKQRCSM